MTAEWYVGVDGCRGGWLACRRDGRSSTVHFQVFERFAELIEAEREARRIAIDIPIGLTEDGRARACDVAARRKLGWPRASSVFSAPGRLVLLEKSYVKANARSRTLTGRGISKQAYNIYAKVAEVDAAMTPELQKKIRETHPELCFQRLAGKGMLWPKRTVEGYQERRRVLRKDSGIALPKREEVRAMGLAAAPDDVLDAAVLAVTAARCDLGRLPEFAEIDARGLRMEICF